MRSRKFISLNDAARTLPNVVRSSPHHAVRCIASFDRALLCKCVHSRCCGGRIASGQWHVLAARLPNGVLLSHSP